MTKPREKTREELQAEIEDGNKKRRSTQLRPGKSKKPVTKTKIYQVDR